MKVTATVDELEPEREKGQIASTDKDIGVSVVALTPNTARRYGLKTTEGLLITEVRQGSEADRENLTAGMIILEVNRQKVIRSGTSRTSSRRPPAGRGHPPRPPGDRRPAPGLHRHPQGP